jgi:lysine-arginine-ornithine-binding protein
MKKTLIAFALALAASGVCAKDWKQIRFGTDPAYAPFESKGVDGKPMGFDIDLGNAICARLDAKCVWVENDFDGLIPALKAKKFDAILASMSVTEARQQEVAFTDKTYDIATQMVARKGSGLLPEVASLRGKRVGVQQGTIQESYAKAHWQSAGVTVVPYQSQDLVYQDLVSGRLDASLQDAVAADQGFLKTSSGQGFAFAGPKLEDPKILGVGAAIAIRKEDSDLRGVINKALASIISDGTYKKIAQKYFSFDIY